MTTRRGRLLLAYLVVLLTAGTASLLSSGSAGAETVATTRRVTAANWYWRAQVVSPVDGSPVLHDPGEGDHGDTLVVAGPNADGEPDRFSVLKMDLVGLPPAASLRRALLVLPLSGSVGVPTTGTPADPTVEDAPVLPSLVVCTARG